MLALPMALFLVDLPERTRCAGSALEIGAPIVSSEHITRYVASTAQIDDASGNIVGWAYLTKSAKDNTIYVQLKKPLDASLLSHAHLRWLSNNSLSSLGALGAKWPWTSLTARKCSLPMRP